MQRTMIGLGLLVGLLLSQNLFGKAPGNNEFESLYFTGSGQCALCHNGLTSSTGEDLSLQTAWSASMMAHAARDPFWQAKVASELHRHPFLDEVIDQTCSRCHLPMANDEARKRDEPIQIFSDAFSVGFLDERHAYYDAAMDGVSCSLCHQIRDNGLLGSVDGHSGRFEIADYILEGGLRVDRPIFGQYSNPVIDPMRNFVSFTPTHGTHMADSALCAGCHDLKTPHLNAQGELEAVDADEGFPEQMIYSEWAHSAFAEGQPLERSCQDCHMPKLDEAVRIANRPTHVTARTGFARHDFHGANTVMLDLLQRNREQLGVPADIDFSRAITGTRAFLQQAAQVSIRAWVVYEHSVRVRIRVSNLSGHKFPTGYPSRRAYLHVILKDGDGRIFFESGRLRSDGSIAEVDADDHPGRYEAHYDVIERPEQVQVYESVMADSEGLPTHTLLRAVRYIKDNRLLPEGFDKVLAADEIAVHGAAFADTDFIAGSDEIEYRIDLAALSVNTERIRVEVELRYQPLAYSHLQDLFQDSVQVAQVASFKRLWEAPETFHDELISKDEDDFDNVAGCGGLDVTLQDMAIHQDFSCQAEARIRAQNLVVHDGGQARFVAEEVALGAGFSIRAGGRLSIGQTP